MNTPRVMVISVVIKQMRSECSEASWPQHPFVTFSFDEVSASAYLIVKKARNMSFLDELLLLDTTCGGTSGAIGSSGATAPIALDDAIFDGFDVSLAPGSTLEDEAASLSSLLADWTDSDSWELASDSCGSSVGTPPPQYAEDEQQRPDQKKRKMVGNTGTKPVASTVTSVTQAAVAAPLKRPRKHNRLEIIKLRDEVEQLQNRLSKLQKTGGSQQVVSAAPRVAVSVAVAAQYALRKEEKKRNKQFGGSAYTVSFPRSVWLDLAVEQYSELQISEKLNRRLRDAVDRQMKVYESFQTLVNTTSRAEDMDLLTKISSAEKCCERHDPLQPTLPSLFQSVANQMSETDAILLSISRLNDINSVFHSCVTKQNAVRGPTFELTTNTPVTGHYEQFSRTLWDRITECSAQQHIPLPSNSTRLKRVHLTLQNDDGCVRLIGMVVLRKFEEKNRTVITLAASYVVEGSELVFRENGWVIISVGDTSVPEYLPSWAKPSSRVLMQTFYRLSSEKQDSQSATGSAPFTQAPDKDTKFMQEFVIQALGEKVREHKVELQTSLLSVSPEVGFSKMDFIDCPLIDSPCS